MASPDFQRLPGFRDFLPEDLAFRAHIFRAWRAVATRYGFQEYDGPPLESLDLYVEKSGQEIVGQLYNFVDKGDRQVSLRPEMTPSLARILGEHARSMPKPIRWFSLPQLFRYERQQRGRLREHFQWNVDVVGEEDVTADAEVLAVAVDGLRELGLNADDFRARVSDRRLLTAVLRDGIGIAEDRLDAAFAIIDKVERMPEEVRGRKVQEETGVDAAGAEALLGLLGAVELDELAQRFPDAPSVAEAAEPLRRYRELLRAMGLGAYVEVDLTIVRGLAYYTGIVFELFDARGELRAICGGGRYDRLLELVGGDPLPAVGFGMGDVVLGELLADRGLVPEPERSLDYFLVIIGEEQRAGAMGLAHRLRDAGHRVAYELRGRSVRKQFKSAENEGAREVLVLGPEEAAEGVVVVRDMASGEERRVAPEALT